MTDALEGQIPRRPAAPQLRIGTAERDAATDELRRHMIDGRLEAEELQERLQGVYGAKTYGDLATLMHDLPPLRPVDRGPVSPAPQVGADTGRPRPGRPSHPAHSALRWWLVGPWVSVNALMVLIWAVSGGGYFWPIWVMGPWGLAILPGALWPSRHGMRAGRSCGSGQVRTRYE